MNTIVWILIIALSLVTLIAIGFLFYKQYFSEPHHVIGSVEGDQSSMAGRVREILEAKRHGRKAAERHGRKAAKKFKEAAKNFKEAQAHANEAQTHLNQAQAHATVLK